MMPIRVRHIPLTLALAVLGAAPACPPPKRLVSASFSPSRLTFSQQVVSSAGSASPPQTVTLTAGAQAALVINGIDASGDFSETNNCSSPLTAGGTCEIQVSFTPNSIGTILGAVTLHSNAIGSPHVVNLAGTGLPPVTFSPAKLAFGDVPVNVTSAAKAVTLTNNQADALAINSIGITGNYSQTNNCPASLGPGQSCQISVQFKPTAAKDTPGALNVAADASPGTQPVGLSGVGTGSASSQVGFSVSSLAFGNEEAGSESSAKPATVTNQGTTSLTIQSVAISAGYSSTDDCAGKVLSPGATCTIEVKFAPDADFVTVEYPGAITIMDSDNSSPQVIGLTGTGVAPITSSPASIDFGQVLADQTSAPRTVTLTNKDSATQGIALAPSGGFALGNTTCGADLESGAACSADIAVTTNTLRGNASGHISGALTITPSNSGFLSPQVVSLNACATALAVSPPHFNFGAVAVGDSSAPETMTITDIFGNGFDVSATALSGANPGDFTITNNTCAPGVSGSCTMDVTYSPQASGNRSAKVTVTDDDGCSPHQQLLNGGSAAGPFTVYVNVASINGPGIVTSSPAGINCTIVGGTCFASFAAGTSVTLTAAGSSSQPGAHLSAWSGACSGSDSCVIDMNSDQELTATFVPDPQLILTIAGGGNGSVSSNPAGIDCEVPLTSTTTCVATFPPGSSVTLTASPASDSSFKGWSGGACSGTSTCTFTSTADQTVTATMQFLNPPDFSLTASAPAPAAVSAGQTATSTLNVDGANGFSASVALTCSVQPAAALAPRCSISPTSVAPGGAATLAISTTAPVLARNSSAHRLGYALWLPLAGLALALGVSRAKCGKSKRSPALAFWGVVLLFVTLQSACGGGDSTKSGTPKGTYTVTIDGVSGTTRHSTTVLLNVD